MQENQVSVISRLSVVNHDFGPSTEGPEAETEYSAVAIGLVEALVILTRYHLVEEIWVLAQTGSGRQKPTITWKQTIMVRLNNMLLDRCQITPVFMEKKTG